MNWKNVAFAMRDKLLARKIAGEPVEELAQAVGMRPTTLDRRLREWAALNKDDQLRRPSKKQKLWNQPPRFSGDSLVAGDFHIPYLDYEFAELMLDVAKARLKRPRRLIIAGDLFNMSIFSSFLATNPEVPSFREELESAANFLSDSLSVFDIIEVLLGNHELRFIYRVLGQLGNSDLEKIVGVDNVRFYEYSHCILATVTGDWRITHQRNYSVNSQSVGVKLANKFRQHIITHHQHKVSKGFDPSGENVIIDNGCMADPAMLDYTNQIDNTSPMMMQSFVIIKDGVGELYSNHRAFTDYSFLG